MLVLLGAILEVLYTPGWESPVCGDTPKQGMQCQRLKLCGQFFADRLPSCIVTYETRQEVCRGSSINWSCTHPPSDGITHGRPDFLAANTLGSFPTAAKGGKHKGWSSTGMK